MLYTVCIFFNVYHIQILSTERSYGGSCLCYDVIMILTGLLCLCLPGHIIKIRQEAESQDQGVNLQHKSQDACGHGLSPETSSTSGQ